MGMTREEMAGVYDEMRSLYFLPKLKEGVLPN